MKDLQRPLVLVLTALFTAVPAAALDLAAMWNFDDPQASEQRFRAALETASGDDVIILKTQIARTYGLRRDFGKAREMLRSLESEVGGAGAEARARWALELGRTYASATHPAASQTPQARQSARQAYLRALGTARDAKLDGLAIDAIHMLAFVDTAPEEQLKWGQEALAVVIASTQPGAKRWEASIRNNIGYALHGLGRYEEALLQFQEAVRLRKLQGDPGAVRTAQWMVAWTLRSLGRGDEALRIQLRLEREADAAGQPDPYVFEELEILYRARGDAARALHYANRRKVSGR